MDHEQTKQAIAIEKMKLRQAEGELRFATLQLAMNAVDKLSRGDDGVKPGETVVEVAEKYMQWVMKPESKIIS